MNLIRYNPWQETRGIQNLFDRFFDEPFAPMRRAGLDAALAWHPAADISEKDDTYLIRAELPGVKKENISVDLKGRTLTITGERSNEAETENENLHRKERVFGKFTRAFMLPGEVDPEKIDASYKDGVLTVTVPKSEAEKPKQITIH